MAGFTHGGWGWKALAGAAAMLVCVGGGPSSRDAVPAPLEKELVVVSTGGTFEQLLKEHFYEPFSRATGVRVIPVAATTSDQWARVKGMTQAGRVEWDVVSVNIFDLVAQRQYLVDFGDCRALPNVAAQGISGTCRRYGTLRTIGGGLIAYSAKAFPAGAGPRNWADFWDTKRFPGPRALLNSGVPWWNLMAALMADGVPSEKLFPLDLDRAFRKLDELKPHVKVWWKTGDQSQQIMRDGEVVTAIMYSGRALGLKAAGAPIEVEWNQAIKDVASWGILKGAPHPSAAMAFLNFFMDRPEAHLAFSRGMFYETSNRLALELVPAVERRSYATHAENWTRMVDEDVEWVATNRERILERWNAWLAR